MNILIIGGGKSTKNFIEVLFVSDYNIYLTSKNIYGDTKELSKRYNLAYIDYNNIYTIIKDIDLVIIASKLGSKHIFLKKLVELEYKKDVILEKPLSLKLENLEYIDRIIESDKIEINEFGGTVTNYIYSKFETWFDKTPTKVNINKRFIAYIIDSFIGGLFTNFPIAMTWLFMTKNVEAVNRVNILMIYKHISINATILALILSTLAALLYYFVIPTYVKNGQTFGKSIMKFKVVKLDGSNVGAKEMFLRQVVGIIILEGTFYGISSVLRWGISIITGLNFTGILMYLGLGISLISLGMLIFSGSKRMLHDYIGKTKLELVEE